MKKQNRFTFWNGWHSVPRSKQPELKAELMNALGLTSDIAFVYRRRGAVEPKVSEKEAIEAIFLKYGVPSSNAWGGSCK